MAVHHNKSVVFRAQKNSYIIMCKEGLIWGGGGGGKKCRVKKKKPDLFSVVAACSGLRLHAPAVSKPYDNTPRLQGGVSGAWFKAYRVQGLETSLRRVRRKSYYGRRGSPRVTRPISLHPGAGR